MSYFDNDLIFYDENNNVINNKFWESIEQIFSKKYIKPTDRVLELGGRYGTVSCVINKILDNKTNQVVIEPDKTVWDALYKNKINNDCKFHIVNGFLSNVKLSIKEDGYGTSGYKDESSDVPNFTLDQINSLYNIDFNVLVIDCEGCICQFLDENGSILEKIELILLEADQSKLCNYKEIYNILENYGFKKVYSILHQQVWKKDSRQ